jgi:hypothetical protein
MRNFILILVISLVLIGIAIFVYTTTPLSHQTSGIPEASIKPTTPPAPTGWKQFTNTAMNLTFFYPPALQLTQYSQQLVSLSDPAYADAEDEVLVYSTVTSSVNGFDVDVPFPISGQLKQSKPVQLPGFQAVMDVYGDTTKQTQVLLMKQGKQLIAIRYPAHKDIDQAVLEQIIKSITLIHNAIPS